jgi:uncharacterized membrane protein
VADQASEQIRVAAPADRCSEVAVDFERYPQWAKDVKQVTVHERDDQGRGVKVEYRAAALGRSIRYTLAYDFAKAPQSFSWSLVEGDLVRRLDGTYQFEPVGAETLVTYELSVDLAFPLPGLVKRRAAGIIIGTALKELKRRVEAG